MKNGIKCSWNFVTALILYGDRSLGMGTALSLWCSRILEMYKADKTCNIKKFLEGTEQKIFYGAGWKGYFM